MNSATLKVLYWNGAEKTRVINGIGNAESLLATVRQGKQSVDKTILASTTDGHACTIDLAAVADIEVIAYNPDI